VKQLLISFLLLLLGLVPSTQAQSLSSATLTGLKFEQKLNTQLNLALPFKDETGRPVKLGDYFGSKPVILDLGYYECPMLCSLVLNGLIESLQSVDGNIGKDFEVVCVSISPTETPALAAAKKRTYVKRYARPGAAAGWHFLTGDSPAIKELANEVGFEYIYDPQSKQYAHASGLVITTPEGKVSKYFFGVSYAPEDLQSALSAASAKQVGSRVHDLLILCCSFLPLIGKHSAAVLRAVRIGGVLVLFGLIGYVIWSAAQPKTATEPDQAEPAAKERS
jgi:protein SCO1/2